MMRRIFGLSSRVALAILAATVALALLATPAAAESTYSATFDEAQEVPPTGSSGTGSGTVVLNDAKDSALVSLTFSGLTGSPLKWHIHCGAPPGENAPIVFDPGLDAPATDEKWMLTSTDVANLTAGLCYFNVHTDVEPGGEIRGQITINPVPAVGGIAELSNAEGTPLDAGGESGLGAGALAGIAAGAAAVAVALGGTGWYLARRNA